MDIRYILGRAGKGKSHQIFREIEQSLQEGGEEPLILLVPEQFTLQSERDLIQKLKLPGIMRVEVLSFTRLAQRVFNEVGGLTYVLLNEQGKNMVLRKIIDEVSRDLTIYKKAAQKDGFVGEFSQLLSELKQQDILPDQLRSAMEEVGEEFILKQKINDIALIYQHFNDYLQGHYLDTEDYLNLFIEKIEGAHFLRGARVWVDGFTTFSTQSLKIINKVMVLARNTTISLSLDTNQRSRDHDLFSLSWRSWQKIRNIAQEHGLSEETIRLNNSSANLNKNPEILHLESELYAYPHRSFPGKVLNLELFAATNINSELEYVAAQIIMLTRERGCRWRDIAVVCHDMSSYACIFKRVFNEYGIPYFMDQKRSIMNNPIIQLVLSSLEVIRRGYRYEDVFSLLKSGFSGVDSDEIEKLENYALRYGIQGQRWKEEFVMDTAKPGNELNCWREIFITPLQKLEKALSGKKTIAEISRAHYEYLEDIGIKQRLEEWIDKLNSQGRFDLVRENAQLWNIIVDIFDQLVEILGDQEVSLKKYLRILEEGYLSLEVGIIPTTIDQVLVGDIQRSKSHDIRALLVVGVNDGVLPSGQEEAGILSENEKELLLERGLDLGFEYDSRFKEEKFLIYAALTKPEEYLSLSYALADAEGKALRPSLLINRFQRIFPELKIGSDVDKQPADQLRQISTPASSFKFLALNLRQFLDGKLIEDIWWDTYAWYYEQDSWQERRSSLTEGLFHHNQTGFISTKNARQLYPRPLHSTVSRVEQFVNCPFAHFVRYGLKPQERKVFTVESPDVGELFHDCLRSFAQKLRDDQINWAELPQAECGRIMDGIMDELVPLHGHGVFASTHRYQYLVKRLKRISRRAAWILTEHLQNGEFVPLAHEVSFGPNCAFPAIEIELEDGEMFYLVGRIDRVDLLDSEEGTFVKIIDYKSGNQQFNLSDVYYGLSMQLLIYLKAVLTSNKQLQRKQLKPAGVFYFKIEDPLIRTESRVVETIEKEIAKKLKLRGVVLEDVQLVRQMDRNITGNSEILPVAINQNETFARNSSVLAETDFINLIRHIKGLLRRIGQEILQGKIIIEPVNDSYRNACTYCLYRSVCQFDRLLQDNTYRNIRGLNNEEVIARIRSPKEEIIDARVD